MKEEARKGKIEGLRSRADTHCLNKREANANKMLLWVKGFRIFVKRAKP